MIRMFITIIAFVLWTNSVGVLIMPQDNSLLRGLTAALWMVIGWMIINEYIRFNERYLEPFLSAKFSKIWNMIRFN